MAGEISGKATGRLLALIGPNVVSGAVPTGPTPPALVLTGLGVWYYPGMPLRTAWFLRRWGICFFLGTALASGGDTLGLVVWRLFGSLIAVAPRAGSCSRPYSGSLESFVCSNCRGKAFHFRHAVAVMQSRGVVRELIHRFKYGRRDMARRIAGRISARAA